MTANVHSWLSSLNEHEWVAIAAIAAAVSAFISFVATTVQARSADQSRKANEAIVAHTFFAEYGSPQMLNDMILLSRFQKDNPEDFAQKFISGRFTNSLMKELDNARRRVKTHYLKAVWLHRKKLISEALFISIIDSRGILLLQKVVIPMTIATDNPTNPEIGDYEYLEKYHRQLRWCTEYKDDDV